MFCDRMLSLALMIEILIVGKQHFQEYKAIKTREEVKKNRVK